MSHRMACAILAAVLVAALSGMAAADEPAANRDARVDALFAGWDRADAPGCAVGVVRDGRLVYRHGFGSANLDYEVPNSPQTVFEVGSMSKSFVCACLALLIDEGRVSPEDDVRKYLPELHAHDPPIRVRHLVRCRSGVWAQWHVMQLAGWSAEPLESPYTPADVLAVLAGQRRLPFKPGTKFRYSSGDYFLLGQIIERVSGMPLGEFTRRRLFEPLGMSRTFFARDPTRVVRGRAVGYYRGPGGELRRWTTRGSAVGGWGLKTCVDDLARWAANFDDNQINGGEHFATFLREGTLLGNRNVLDADPAGAYRGLKRIQFTGGMPGYLGALACYPQQRTHVICLTNNSQINPWVHAERIADVYLEDALGPPVDAAEENRRRAPAVELPEAQLRDKAGDYQDEHGRIWRLELRDGALRVTDPLNQAYALQPVSETTFRPPKDCPAPDNRFVFSRKSAEEPCTLTLRWDRSPGLRLEPVRLVGPADVHPEEYAGEYFSEELGATYRFAARPDGLWLRVNSRRWERLDATLADQFIPHARQPHDARVIDFLRDDAGNVGGFRVRLWRVREIEFLRRPAAGDGP